jgi:hypothetical protein
MMRLKAFSARAFTVKVKGGRRIERRKEGRRGNREGERGKEKVRTSTS